MKLSKLDKLCNIIATIAQLSLQPIVERTHPRTPLTPKNSKYAHIPTLITLLLSFPIQSTTKINIISLNSMRRVFKTRIFTIKPSQSFINNKLSKEKITSRAKTIFRNITLKAPNSSSGSQRTRREEIINYYRLS